MTDADQPRPAPGSPPPVPGPPAVALRFASLADRPVAEHVAEFEAEHDRLRRELSTIDQL